MSMIGKPGARRITNVALVGLQYTWTLECGHELKMDNVPTKLQVRAICHTCTTRPPERNQSATRLRMSRRARGLCPRCGLPPAPGHVQCAECLEPRAKPRDKKESPPRAEAGGGE